jgi:hypothetical protein
MVACYAESKERRSNSSLQTLNDPAQAVVFTTCSKVKLKCWQMVLMSIKQRKKVTTPAAALTKVRWGYLHSR